MVLLRPLLALTTLTMTTFASPAIRPTAAIPSTDDDPAPSLSPTIPSHIPEAPPRAAYGGVLTCHAASVPSSDPNHFMTRDEAKNAISTFCSRVSGQGAVFKQTGGTPIQAMQDDGPFGYPIYMMAYWQPLLRTDCPEFSFGNYTAADTCKEMLLHNIVDECNIAKNGLQFWKAGGRFQKDCITWEIRRSASLDPKPVQEGQGWDRDDLRKRRGAA